MKNQRNPIFKKANEKRPDQGKNETISEAGEDQSAKIIEHKREQNLVNFLEFQADTIPKNKISHSYFGSLEGVGSMSREGELD